MRALLLMLVCAGCVDTTGSDLVTFRAGVSGPRDAVAGQPLVTDTGLGYHVTITQAVIHMGALYLNRSMPGAGAQPNPCVLQGIYNGEVRGGIDVDAMSPELQMFPVTGDGTADPSTTAEIWLSGGDVNVDTDPTIVLRVAGTAERAGMSFPFTGQVTINQNWQLPNDPALPGANPICKRRIITPIPVSFTPTDGGLLRLEVNPRLWFANVDFAEVTPVAGAPGQFVFRDTIDDQQSKNLFNGFRAATGGAYTFTWEPAAP